MSVLELGVVRRFAAYGKDREIAFRVFAVTAREALGKAKGIREGELWPGIWYVVEDPMAEITRGD